MSQRRRPEGEILPSWERLLTDLVVVRGAALKRYAYLLCGDETTAEDLVQDAMLRVFSVPRRSDIGDIERYVRRAIFNQVVDHARRRAVWARLRPRIATPAQASEVAVDVGLDVQRALLALSTQQRVCLVLHYYVDLPVAEIADMLNVSAGTVKRHLVDGRQRLGRLLRPAGPVGG